MGFIEAYPDGAIAEGRDVGTVVCPKADLKIFLTASLKTRAERRYHQLAKQGTLNQSIAELQEAIRKRDEQDEQRGASPLVKAPDAIEFDTSEQSFDECLENLLKMITKHFSDPVKTENSLP